LKVTGVIVIDLHAAMRKARDARTAPYSGDKVHPGDDGHLLMAKTILTALGAKVPDVLRHLNYSRRGETDPDHRRPVTLEEVRRFFLRSLFHYQNADVSGKGARNGDADPERVAAAIRTDEGNGVEVTGCPSSRGIVHAILRFFNAMIGWILDDEEPLVIRQVVGRDRQILPGFIQSREQLA
jgi:hypothetical protein